LVQYETLVKDPEHALKQIYEFIGDSGVVNLSSVKEAKATFN
jgi:hypothetical protein